MYRHAAKSAAQPNSSLKAPSVAFRYSRERNGGCTWPSLYGAFVAMRWATVWANIHRRDREFDFGASGSLPPRIPSSARGHASGPNRRPAARRRSASLSAPPRGLGSSQKKFESRGKEHRANFFRAPPRKHSLALGSRAHSLALPSVTRAGYGKFNETEITTMYLSVMWNWGGFASAICRATPGLRAPGAADATMSWMPTGGPGGALGRRITPRRRTE